MFTPPTQVGLLIRMLPYAAKEACFALKSGTAINQFKTKHTSYLIFLLSKHTFKIIL